MNRPTSLQRDVLVGLMAIVAVIAFALIGYAMKQNSQQRNSLTRQVTFLCGTTSILDRLVVDGFKTSQENLKNGTYSKLQQAGLLPPGFIAQVKRQIETYERAHGDLTRGELGVCK